jgi:hypothetical protein
LSVLPVEDLDGLFQTHQVHLQLQIAAPVNQQQ